jgi:hypothetical protein
MFGRAPKGCISACVLSFKVTMNSNGSFPSMTVTCSPLPSISVLVIGDGELLSEGSALLNSPSSFSAIFDPVTDPLKPDSFRTRIIVAKLRSLNIQCHVPANACAAFEDPESACRLVAHASTAPEPNVMLIANASPIRPARDSGELRERPVSADQFDDEGIMKTLRYMAREFHLPANTFECAVLLNELITAIRTMHRWLQEIKSI